MVFVIDNKEGVCDLFWVVFVFYYVIFVYN